MKRTVLIFTTLLIASACKEKESAKRNNPTAINQKIDALLKEAAAATDDNKKAALFGDASELLIDKGDLRQAMVAARQGEKDGEGQQGKDASHGGQPGEWNGRATTKGASEE